MDLMKAGRVQALNRAFSTQIILSVSQADGGGVMTEQQPYDFSPLTDSVRVVYTINIH